MSGTSINFQEKERMKAHFSLTRTCDLKTCEYCNNGQQELIKAHVSFPKTCNPNTCEYCNNELRQKHEDEQFAYAEEMRKMFGPNWRENMRFPPRFT
jgi:hypothetical protein